MRLTDEQQEIVNKIQEPDCKLVKVDAVAGAGKTTLLTEIVKVIKPKIGLYLAYNKAIATEASHKFPPGSVQCKTTHGMAYQNTIHPYKLNLGFFNHKNIGERVSFETKLMVLDIFKKFCLSKYDSFKEYMNHEQNMNPNLNDQMFEIARKAFNAMAKGTQPITHEGYLKLYHMLLAHKKIVHKEFDLVMLDESGDINEVTLEIFKLLPAKKKLMVGDNNQNIYTFNQTINGFARMKDEGIQMKMTQSFRCSSQIAERIELFCKTYMDPSMDFMGTSTPRTPDNTVAIISRNNSTLIGEMITLNARRIKYNLTRKASVIFEVVLILLNLKPGATIFSGEWRYLQKDVDNWGNNPHLKMEFTTPLKYIHALYGEEPALKTGMAIIGKFGPGPIFAAYNTAKAHEEEKGHPLTLSTAHSMKGMEYSTVRICEDLNESIKKIVDENGTDISSYSEKQAEATRLYYVACSRSINKLENAAWLPDPEFI